MNLSLNLTLPDILALCEANLDDSIDSGNFSVRGYLPLIRKDSSTHTHGLAVYVKEGLPFAQDLSLENSADSYLCFRLALLHSVSYLFFLYRSPSSLLCTVFDSISSNIDDVLSINPSANVFVFGDFNAHHKDWLTYSGGTDRPGELCYNFSISNDLTQIVMELWSYGVMELWSNGLVVKALDSQSRGPMFKTTGWLQGQLSLSSFRGR